MKIDLSLPKQLVADSKLMSDVEKKEALGLLEFLESDPAASEWVKQYASFKTRIEYFWHKLEFDLELVTVNIEKLYGERQMAARKCLSDNGVKVTEGAVAIALNSDPEIIAERMKKLEMQRLLALFKSLSFNINKDLVVQDSVNQRQESQA